MNRCYNCFYCRYTGPGKFFCADCNCPIEEVMECEGFEPLYKPVTNADRIRSMTDEELAEWMRDIMSRWCPKRTSLCDGNCKKCTLDWLRQEASDG